MTSRRNDGLGAVLSPSVPRASGDGDFTRRVWAIACIATLVVGCGAAFILASDVFFLFFAAVLLAILLRAAGDALNRWTGLGNGWSLGVVVLLLAVGTAGGLYLVGATIAGQVSQLVTALPHSVQQARAYLNGEAWGRELLGHAPSADSFLSGRGGEVATRARSFFSTTLGAAGNLLVLVFLGLYMAAAPEKYISGLMVMVPPGRRSRAREVAQAVGFHLRWWLIGRFVAMVAVGAIVAIGLWVSGVPQFLVLGLLAGVLTAVPFFGPFLAAVPGVLLALVQGPTEALWAASVYLLAQAVENYLLTPLIQQRTVNLPPALAIATLTLAGALFGVVALVVASPVAVALTVVVKMLYIEDALGEEMGVQGVDGPRTAAVRGKE